MKKYPPLFPLFLASSFACAAPAPSAPDFSGTYACTGDDAHEGKYTGTVTLERVASQSFKEYAAYTFKLEVPGYGSYPGYAAARGTEMAIHFALTDPSTKDYGVGTASFKKGKGGKWSFKKYYFEPEFKGGNYGFEDCVQQ